MTDEYRISRSFLAHESAQSRPSSIPSASMCKLRMCFADLILAPKPNILLHRLHALMSVAWTDVELPVSIQLHAYHFYVDLSFQPLLRGLFLLDHCRRCCATISILGHGPCKTSSSVPSRDLKARLTCGPRGVAMRVGSSLI